MPTFRPAFAVLLVWVLASGCSTSTTYRRPTSPTEAAWLLNRPGKSEVELVTASADGPVAKRGVLAPLDGHDFAFTDRAGKSLVVPFEQTQSITYKSRANGAGFGFLYGAIPGLLAGFISGLLLESTLCDMGDRKPGDCESGVSIGMKMGVLGGFLTGVVGAGIGAAVGKDMTIRF